MGVICPQLADVEQMLAPDGATYNTELANGKAVVRDLLPDPRPLRCLAAVRVAAALHRAIRN